jgi:hypothetical protein
LSEMRMSVAAAGGLQIEEWVAGTAAATAASQDASQVKSSGSRKMLCRFNASHDNTRLLKNAADADSAPFTFLLVSKSRFHFFFPYPPTKCQSSKGFHLCLTDRFRTSSGRMTFRSFPMISIGRCLTQFRLTLFFADCHFGKQVYELEETWHPDLGPPFGVMYCIRCECMAVS